MPREFPFFKRAMYNSVQDKVHPYFSMGDDVGEFDGIGTFQHPVRMQKSANPARER